MRRYISHNSFVKNNLLINVKYLLSQERQAHAAQKNLSNDIFAARYCMSLVEKNDYENYLCTLLLKGERRRHAFALRAFNVEVSKCSANISEEQLVKMRLKFWNDSIDKCFDNKSSYVTDQPVLRELKYIVDKHKLTKLYLKRLVTARDRPLNQQFMTLKQLEEYAEQTFSSIIYLLVELYGIKDLQVDHAVSHLGKAQGIATFLRAIPYKGRSQALYIPQEILIKHGVSQERIIRDKPNDKGVEECVFEVATTAHQHLKKARSLSDKIPKEIRKLFLPLVAVERYLERLRKTNFSLTDPTCLQRDALLPVALYWFNLRNKY
ncbi:NADH dehydrogenase (ubiquinone) complex I, assembly factor 6 homolog [Teleopsis dalmanni]|uniref:NADH dehydrogenase (ubiquinone) complex I, assembly factor 6 homolog n=1 Tax=Teleopsis dalmanni TaxID=139649 RepID=UPI0018CFA032|nr:NADH dehydrogenase (ubiquinone) complex I, assembly factor 6 homolog [Teleopsis dalmanni]